MEWGGKLMAITNANYAEDYVTNYTRPITFTVTNGRTLILYVLRGAGTVTGVTDNSSGTPAWTDDGTVTFDGVTFYRYRRHNVSGSPTNVNISGTVEEFYFTWLFEDDDLSSTQPEATDAQQHSSSFTTSHTFNYDQLTDNSRALMLLKVRYNTGNITTPAGWTRVRSGSVSRDMAYNTGNLGTSAGTMNITLAAADEMYARITQYAAAGATSSAHLRFNLLGVG